MTGWSDKLEKSPAAFHVAVLSPENVLKLRYGNNSVTDTMTGAEWRAVGALS